MIYHAFISPLHCSGRRRRVLHLLGAVPRAAPALRHVLPLRVEVRLRGHLPGQSTYGQYYRVVQLNVTPEIELFYRADGVDGPQEMEKKLSNSQACCLAQLCLAAA